MHSLITRKEANNKKCLVSETRKAFFRVIQIQRRGVYKPFFNQGSSRVSRASFGGGSLYLLLD